MFEEPRLPVLLGVCLLLALAGCSGLSGDGGESDDGMVTPSDTSTPTQTAGTATPSASTPAGTASPTATATPTPSRIQVVATVGDNIESNAIPTVNLTIKPSPGAEDIDLRELTVEWLGPRGSFTLVAASQSGSENTFTSTPFKDPDGSHPVLTEADDRTILTFEPATFTGSLLQEGETVTLRLTTATGARSTVRLDVPDSLDGKQAVAL